MSSIRTQRGRTQRGRTQRGRTQRGRTLVAAAAGLALAASPVALSGAAVADGRTSPTSDSARSAAKADPNETRLQLLAINDFHGQLEPVPTTSSSGRVGSTPAGGVAYLATELTKLRRQAHYWGGASMTVAAGDLIGASPLLSAAFHDEPTIEAMNLLGLQVSSVGNHEFDEGWRELKRMRRGGCLDDGDGANNQDSCPGGKSFAGADFNYLSANVKRTSTGKTLFRPYVIRKVDGKKVGFIGMTLQDTPNIVTRSGVEGLRFTDEVKTANRLVPKLEEKGVKAIVVLLHEGGFPSSLAADGCADVSGPGIEIAKALDPQIDVVIEGHTHQPYNCTVLDPAGKKRLVTSAYSIGRVVTEINLTLGKKGQVKRNKTIASNHVVSNDYGTTPSEALVALIDRYKTLVGPIANAVLGHIEGSDKVTRTPDADGRDSELGNLIADAQKVDASIAPAGKAKPVVAFMNPGGIRADLLENEAGEVTYGAAFTVQPFNNYDASFDLTGQQILDLLNEQWNGRNEADAAATDPTAPYKVLQVSGLKYTWDESEALKKDANAIVGDVLIDANGDGTVEDTEKLDPATTYRVAANAFLADGGDGFSTFTEAADKLLGGLDIDALADYLKAHDPYTPTATDRISSQP